MESYVQSLEEDYSRVLKEGDKKINKLRQENHTLHMKAHYSKENAAIELRNLKRNYDHIKQKYNKLYKTRNDEVLDLRDALTVRARQLDEKNNELQKMECKLERTEEQVIYLQEKMRFDKNYVMEKEDEIKKLQKRIHKWEKRGTDG